MTSCARYELEGGNDRDLERALVAAAILLRCDAYLGQWPLGRDTPMIFSRERERPFPRMPHIGIG